MDNIEQGVVKLLYLVITSVIWSLSFGLIKAQLTGLDSYLVAFLRLAISFLVFLPFLRKTSPSLALRLTTLGGIQFGCMYCLYIKSYAYLTGAQVALLTVTTPLFVVAWDFLFNRRKFGRYWLAALLAVVAAVILVWEKQSQHHLQGLLLLQGANALFALGQVWYKRLAPAGAAHHHFAWLYLGGFLVPLLLSFQQGFPTLPTSPKIWLTLLYLGVVASGCGFYLWNQGIRKVSNGMVAVMNNLKIPLGALLAWLLFGEALNAERWIPSAAVFTCALLLLGKVSRNR